MTENVKEEHLEIEIDEDEVQKEADVKVETKEEASPEAEKAKADVDDIDKSINELKEQLERERLARIEAERRAREAAEAASKASGDVHDTNIQLINGAIDTVKRENSMLKSRYREAAATGDADMMAEIQETMSMNAAKLMQLEMGKQQMENRPRPVYEMPASQDPVEAFASQLSPRSAEFIRKNPQCVTDQRMNRIMINAHSLALSKGLQADSDDYFDFVSEALDLPSATKAVRVDDENPLSASAEPVKRRSAPPAAPVSRSAPNNSGTRPNVVRLTKEEREMAQMMGMSNEEYARNKMVLVKEGKLNS
jgi:hypothetical protein